MTTTLADLRSICRNTLASTSDWSNATLDAWIADAIRMYSMQFPRAWRYTLSLTTGTQAYNLPGTHGFLEVKSVEYPSGQTPQRFLYEMPENSDEFQSAYPVYAIRPIEDTTAIESDTAAGKIVFAETVATGESAIIEYLAPHTIPTAGDDDAQISIPVAHWEALVAFVEYRAHQELEADKAISISTGDIGLSQLGTEARRAWLRYKEIMTRLQQMESKSRSISWEADDPRIY